MNQSINVLLISARFPPELDAEALQVAKILPALAQQPDMVIDAVTSNIADNNARESRVFGVRQLVEIGGRLGRAQRALVRMLFPWLMNRPDPFFGFARNWRRVPLLLKHRPDVVYSRAFPLASTLVARDLARYYEVPFILHLSDPWCECALNAYRYSAWHRREEASCLYAANCITFTSITTMRRYVKRYPDLAIRMALHPNVFLASQVCLDTWQSSERLRMVHTGSLTNGRSIEPLLKALAELPPDHPMFQHLELLFAGPVDAKNAAYFRNAPDWLRYAGTLSPEDAFKLQRSADVLLVIDHRFGNANDAQHLLSKLTDYLPHRRRIFALADPGGENYLFVQQNKLGDCVSHSDFAGIRTALENIWDAWSRSDAAYFECGEPDHKYSADAVALELAAVIRRLVGVHK